MLRNGHFISGLCRYGYLLAHFHLELQVCVKAHSLGTHRVAGYVRNEGLKQIGSGDAATASVDSSQQSLVGKPWKKHNNHNKKEKLRRVFAHHDIN